jgi:hypothetical protein
VSVNSPPAALNLLVTVNENGTTNVPVLEFAFRESLWHLCVYGQTFPALGWSTASIPPHLAGNARQNLINDSPNFQQNAPPA